MSGQQVNVQMVELDAIAQINNDLQDEVITMESNKYVLSDMVYDQNNRLIINKELWTQSCLLLVDRRNDEVKSVIRWCENMTYFILQMKQEWAYKGQSTFFWIYPYFLIKSVIITGAIKRDFVLNPCISLPPNTIKAFINHTDVKVLSQVFSANSLFNIPYWLGGPSGQSYIGSSIHLFQNSKMSLDSRVKEHITHADNHRIAKHHKCKQPL